MLLVSNAPRPLGRDTSLCEACHSLGHSSVVSLPLSTWPKGWRVLFWMAVVKYSLPGHCLKAHLLQGVKRHAQSLDLSLVHTPYSNSHKASKLAPSEQSKEFLRNQLRNSPRLLSWCGYLPLVSPPAYIQYTLTLQLRQAAHMHRQCGRPASHHACCTVENTSACPWCLIISFLSYKYKFLGNWKVLYVIQ